MATKIYKELNKRAIVFGEDLMPKDCIEIMKSVYGKRMEKLLPKSLNRIIMDMMATATDNRCTYEISVAINEYLEDF